MVNNLMLFEVHAHGLITDIYIHRQQGTTHTKNTSQGTFLNTPKV